MGGVLVSAALVGPALLRRPEAASPATAQKPRVYRDSMHPWITSDRPGKCPLCQMDLNAVGSEGVPQQFRGLVMMSSNALTIAPVRTTPVEIRSLQRSLKVAGTLEPTDIRKGVLSAPAMGRVDRWWVESVGTEVTNGQPLLAFFSPSWSSRRLYLQGRTATPRNSGADGGSNPGLTVHGGPEPEGRSRANSEFLLDLVAPQAGVLLDRSVLKGQYVQEGDPLLTLADPSTVWFRFEVTDAQAGWLEVGSRGELSVPNDPGPSVPMVVEFVEPVVQAASRTARARATIDNPWVVRNGQRRRSYRFGQYAEAKLHVTGPMVRVVPREAVMFSGESPYVFVVRGSGVYQKHHIRLGRSGDAVWEVLAGVELGDQVVSSGNVLVDAQSQLYQSGDAVPIDGKALAADRWCASGPMGSEMSAVGDALTPANDRGAEGVLPVSRNERLSMEVSEPTSVSQATRPSGLDRSRMAFPSGRKVSRD